MDNKKQKAFWKVIISLFLFAIFAYSWWVQSVVHPNDPLLQKLATAFGGFIGLCIPGLLFGGLALIIFKKINIFANTFIICSLITVYFAYVGLAAKMGNPLF